MILFTIARNQTKLRYIKEVGLGGKRIRQTNGIPRKAMEGGREAGGPGWAGRGFIIVSGNEK